MKQKQVKDAMDKKKKGEKDTAEIILILCS